MFGQNKSATRLIKMMLERNILWSMRALLEAASGFRPMPEKPLKPPWRAAVPTTGGNRQMVGFCDL